VKPKDDKPRCVFAIKRNGEIYRYMARYTDNGFRVYLGCFKTEAEAVAAYQAKLEKEKAKGARK